MAETAFPLAVWAPPELRDAVQQAISLWNTAAGQDWLTLTENPAGAAIRVLHRGGPPGQQRGPALAEATEGPPKSGALTVWIPKDATRTYDLQASGPNTLVHVITHELGHSLGLDHPGVGANQLTPGGSTQRGEMGAGTAMRPIPAEVRQALFSLGISPTPAPAVGPRKGGGDMQQPDLASNLLSEYLRTYNVKGPRSPFAVAAPLVAAGYRARGTTDVDLNHFAMDVGHLAVALAEKPHEPQMAASGKMVQ